MKRFPIKLGNSSEFMYRLNGRWNRFSYYALVFNIFLNLTTTLNHSEVNLNNVANVTKAKTTLVTTEIHVGSEPLAFKCPPGYETKVEDQKIICVKCTVGHFRNVTMEKCTLCPAGEEATIEGMKECTLCYYGKFKGDGELKCHDCPKGTISLLKGAKECLKCPPNFYCPCSVCHPVICSNRGFCPIGTESPLFCKLPLMKRIGPKTSDCALTSELIGLICGGVLLLTLVSSVILANIFLKPRTDVVFVSGTDSGSTRYLLQDASSAEPRYSGL